MAIDVQPSTEVKLTRPSLSATNSSHAVSSFPLLSATHPDDWRQEVTQSSGITDVKRPKFSVEPRMPFLLYSIRLVTSWD